jgi:precorrin-2 dehydrogenase/sirohydrochlorin ferrochelatase
VPVNVVDRPELCDFTTPGIVDRGAVVGAVGTGGAAPVLATLLRNELEALWPADLGAKATLARAMQDEVRAALPHLRLRRAFLRDLLSGPAADLAAAQAKLEAFTASPGRRVEIEAGGPAERLRLSEVRALSQADLVAAEPGCDPAVLAFARRDAERVEGVDDAALEARVAGGALVVVCRARPTP